MSNAGLFSKSQRLDDIDPAEWERSLALNLTSHLSLLRAAAPFLRLGFDPCVVIIGSKNVPAPGVGAANPCRAARSRTALPPARDWKPPLAGCLISVCSGAPCTGR